LKNDFDIRGEVTAIFLKRRDGSLLETLIDTVDLQRAQEFTNTWCAAWNPTTKSFYVTGSLRCGTSQKLIIFHRWITHAPQHLQVDHKNNDTLDNRRKFNLRWCTRSENQRNQKVRNDGSSKFKGVYWYNRHKKYMAQIKVDKKDIFLGYFKTEPEAANAYNDAAIKYHGEFAKLNRL
jgi:hypothetical protein